MGAMVVELRARRLSVMESGIGGLIVINLILSFSIPNISVGAHVGGLIGGALAGFALRATGDRYKLLGLLACVALSVVAVAGSIAVSGVSGVRLCLSSADAGQLDRQRLARRERRGETVGMQDLREQLEPVDQPWARAREVGRGRRPRLRAVRPAPPARARTCPPPAESARRHSRRA